MLMHEHDRSFRRLASAAKRARHFAKETGFIDMRHPLRIQLENMASAWDEDGDELENLILQDWFAEKINAFCDSNQVSEDPYAQQVMHEFVTSWLRIDPVGLAKG